MCKDQPHRCVSLRDCDRKPWPAHRGPPVTLTAFHNPRACNSNLKPRQLARGRIERGRFVIQLLHCNAQQQFCSTSDSFIDNKWPHHVVLCCLSHCLSFTFSSSRISYYPSQPCAKRPLARAFAAIYSLLPLGLPRIPKIAGLQGMQTAATIGRESFSGALHRCRLRLYRMTLRSAQQTVSSITSSLGEAGSAADAAAPTPLGPISAMVTCQTTSTRTMRRVAVITLARSAASLVAARVADAEDDC